MVPERLPRSEDHSPPHAYNGERRRVPLQFRHAHLSELLQQGQEERVWRTPRVPLAHPRHDEANIPCKLAGGEGRGVVPESNDYNKAQGNASMQPYKYF